MHSCLHCIIPPYMMQKLINEPSSRVDLLKQVSSKEIDDKIRARRQFYNALSVATRKALTIHPLKKHAQKETVNREVYTASGKEVLPGKLVRKEGEKPVRDSDVNNVYDAAGFTWDFYYSIFGRNSIDGRGLKLVQTVHYGKKYDNAMWDGQQMLYGDGDGKIFGTFTADIDIIGHELTHGVVQNECALEYRDESGALDESLADIFGIMIKQKVMNQDVKKANWLIGENVMIGDKYALRSLKAPGTAYKNHPVLGTDPQPSHMKNYTDDPYDYGGVHLNSGITNHAFYIAAYDFGGFAWDKAGRIWYAAMCDARNVKKNATFLSFKSATIKHAELIFKSDKSISKIINKAWNTVGVK